MRRQSNARIFSRSCLIAESGVLFLLTREGLHHRESTENLLHDRHPIRLEPLYLVNAPVEILQ